MRTLLSVLAIFFCLGLVLPAREAAKSDISGTWHFVFETDDGGRARDLVFKQDGEKITIKLADGEHEGTFSDGKFSLEFPYSDDEAGAGTLKLKGTLVDGALNGTWQFQEYDGAFKATRAAAAQQ
ncbi:MAG: hypothetical protein JOY54_03390 [Acidobacteriaceae bacterium]|nr:hypothetical protein [Acidobacteriaceae bacterium]